MEHRDRAGLPLHLVYRGKGGNACFDGELDRLAYLDRLEACARRCECAVHAYVLMGNHVHLLLTPARAGGASGLMRSLAEQPWDVSPVHARRYLLACMRYIEMNPVRAGLVAWPGDWRWSSYPANALGAEDALITPHALYCALGRSPELRRARYRALFSGAAAPAAWRGERTPNPGRRAARAR
jgi:putative transposase